MTTAERAEGAVIVTGESRGIGAAIAEKLGEDGYAVVVNYAADVSGAESVVSAIRARGGRALAIHADVAAPDEVADMFQQAQQMGPLAGLINNAGIAGKDARVDEREADELSRLMQVNVVGPMLCAKHAVQAMSTRYGGTGGSIVAIASGAAKAPPGLSGLAAYAATKGAMVTFARALSHEVAAEGIRVNSVSPGIIDTDMPTPAAQAVGASSPLGRMGHPSEIAEAVSWLMSPAASYVTGSDISVNGGL